MAGRMQRPAQLNGKWQNFQGRSLHLQTVNLHSDGTSVLLGVQATNWCHMYTYPDASSAGRMLRGQANRLTYVKQLLRDLCCETVDEFQRMMKNQAEWARVSHTTSSSE